MCNSCLITSSNWEKYIYSSCFTFAYPLTAGVVGAPQMTSQLVPSIFLCSPLPSGAWRTPGLSIPWCCLPIFFVCVCFYLPCLLPPFDVPYKVVFARHDERETCPYHFSLRLFILPALIDIILSGWLTNLHSSVIIPTKRLKDFWKYGLMDLYQVKRGPNRGSWRNPAITSLKNGVAYTEICP